MTHNKIELIVDNTPYPWSESSITEQEIRDLAGLPDNVQIFQAIPSKPDRLVEPNDIISLDGKGPERFSTQAADSGAG